MTNVKNMIHATIKNVTEMSKEEILQEIEAIKEHIKTLACCVNTDELSDRATELHRQLRKLNESATVPA